MKKIVLTKSVDFLFSQIKPKDFKAFVEHLLSFWVPGRAVIACIFHYFLWYSKLLRCINQYFHILFHLHIKPTHFSSFCGVACGYPWVAWGYLGMAWRVMRGLVRGGLGPGVAWGWLGVAGGGLGVAWDDFTIRELSGKQ